MAKKRYSKLDDFLPKNFQSELASLSKDLNRIIFLPIEKDKFHVSVLLVKQLARELIRTDTRIVYFVDSIVNTERLTSFLRNHVSLDISSYIRTTDEEAWHTFVQNSHVLVIACETYAPLPHQLENLISRSKLVVFDDCIYGLQVHPMKKIVDRVTSYEIPPCSSILGLTSTLINDSVQVENIHKYLIQLEKVYKSSIVTSLYCDSVKKYLTNAKIKLSRYISCPTNLLMSSTSFDKINSTINNLNFIVDKFKYDESQTSLKTELKLILDDFSRSFYMFGVYPIFVITCLCRVKLEKVKLQCINSILFSVVSSMISDFNLISMLLKQNIETLGPVDSIDIIEKKCDAKIKKLWSVLLKMEYERTCIIFVQHSIAAQMLVHVLQKLSSVQDDSSGIHIKAALLVDDSSLDVLANRERLFHKKQRHTVLKEFLASQVNVLVLNWENLNNLPEINSDWIIYFDPPPNFMSYVISQKCGNTLENEHIFFLEELADENTKHKLEPYAQLNWDLKELIQKKDFINLEALVRSSRRTITNNVANEVNYLPLVTSSKKEANLSTAISIVNKYCECLPGDAFSHVTPRWTLQKKNEGVVCKLQLPIQSVFRSPIETLPLKDVKLAKQVAALKAVEILYENGQLDEDLLPTVRRVSPELLNDETLYPHWRDEKEEIKPGSSECCRLVPISFPEWFHNCAPRPGLECYIHVIHLQPASLTPDAEHKRTFYDLMNSECEFGIVTSTKLPEICQFPIYADIGEVNVSVEVNTSVTTFTVEQIEKLFAFHRFLFIDVLQAVKGFLTSDHSHRENSYCIVPLNSSGIDWVVVNEQSVKNEIVEPADKDRIHTDYVNRDYLGKVITPWYRVLPQRYYVVTDVLKNRTPNSGFSSEDHKSFTEYYASKYGLEVKQPIQPLLIARPITPNFNYMRPRAQNPGIRRKRGEKETDFEETLIPEFCVLQPFPAVYWYKSITLLTVTHRLHHILLAETIRRRVAFDTIEVLSKWLPLDVDDILTCDADCISELEEITKPTIPISSILKDVKLTKKNRSYPWGMKRLPEIVERNLDKASVLKLMAYHDFVRKEDNVVSRDRNTDDEFDQMSSNQKPSLGFLKKKPSLGFQKKSSELSSGPKQKDILQALTLSECGDIFNLHNQKLAGSSFLKFAASLLLYNLYPNLNVIQLRRLRKRLIGKRNLFYCASKLQLASFLKLQDWSASSDWNFGGFALPELLVNVITNSFIPPEVIFNLEIPRSEQLSGIISFETRNHLQEKMLKYYDQTTKEDSNFLQMETQPCDNSNHVLMYFKKQSVPDKAVVDVLKALAGVYLMNCGVEAGFKFLQFVDVLKRDVSVETLLNSTSESPDSSEEHSFVHFDKLCNIIGYRFRRTQLPIQVFTHHSCFPEQFTECNQKLAFLGDSILGLLITGFVYESRAHLSINEVKDIRVALVNDIVFSVLLVRTGLHKFLCVESPRLIEKIQKFVGEQERVGHKVDNHEFLFLVEETSSRISDSVDVPKALSDTFKALIAAIFLDSSGNLELVWSVYYGLMKNEIDAVTGDIPRNPVKLLAETDIPIEYDKPKVYKRDSELVEVDMIVTIDQLIRSFTGVGSSKNEAARNAAKLALKHMSKEFTL